MKISHNIPIKLAVLLLLNGLMVPSFAELSKDGDLESQWHYTIAPYGWLASLSSDVTVKNITTHISVPFTTALKSLDFSGEIYLEAHRGPWAFMIDPIYTKLSPNRTVGPVYVGPSQIVVGPIDLNLVSQTTLVDAGVFYQFYKTNTGLKGFTSIEALGGGRYFGLKNQLTLAPSNPQNFPGITVSSAINVVAPIIGARINHYYAKTHAWLRADVGGFGVDNVTNTWSTTLGLAYRVKPNWDIGIAYRVFNININQSLDSKISTLMYGPELGIAYQK